MRFTAFEDPTNTSTAKIIQPTAPSCHPGREKRVADRVVWVWTQVTANTAYATPKANCRLLLARLLSPRLRWLRTLMMSSRNPMSPKATIAPQVRIPARVNPTWVPRCPNANPAMTAITITTPPIVGVPAFMAWWLGPSSRMCWPIRASRSRRIKTGVRSPASQSATPPATMRLSTRSSPLTQGTQDGSRHSSVIEVSHDRSDLLGDLMTLSCDEHEVLGPR